MWIADKGSASGSWLCQMVEIGGLLEVEEEGRKLASYYGPIDEEFIRELTEWGLKAHDKLMEADDFVHEKSEKLEELGVPFITYKVGHLLWTLKDIPTSIAEAARMCRNFGRKIGRKTTRQCNSDFPHFIVKMYFEDIMKRLKEVDETAKEVMGKKCTWLLGEIEPYTLNAAINDTTACIHSVATFLAKAFEIPTAPERVSGKCRVLGEATEEAKEFCMAWDKATEKLKQIYSEADYEALEGYATDNKVQLRVGSATGHMTHVDLEKGTVEYYDLDEKVNKIMEKLLEKAGLKCELMNHEVPEGVRCEGKITPEVAKALALATSMDIREYEEPGEWIGEIRKVAPECAGLDPEEREQCIYEKIVKMNS